MERKHVCCVHAPPEDSLTTTAAEAAEAAEATEAGKYRRLSTSIMLCKLHT